MIEFKYIPAKEVEKQINQMFSRKLFFNNYFGMELENVDCYFCQEILVLRKRFDSYCRVYILSVSKAAFCHVLKELPFNSVVNIPSKNSISEINECFTFSGWSSLAIYNRYVNNKIKPRGGREAQYAEISDVDAITSMLYGHFSPITGYLPTREELKNMIIGKQILIDRGKNGDVVGIIGCQVEHGKGYLPFWVSMNGNGLSLLFDVFNILSFEGVKSMRFWVNSQNIETIKLHELLGARHDGLKDYIYIKTVSYER